MEWNPVEFAGMHVSFPPPERSITNWSIETYVPTIIPIIPKVTITETVMSYSYYTLNSRSRNNMIDEIWLKNLPPFFMHLSINNLGDELFKISWSMSGGKINASIEEAIAPMSEIISPKSGIAIAKAHTTMTRAYRSNNSHTNILRAK